MSQFSEEAGQVEQGTPKKKSGGWKWLLISLGGLLVVSFVCCCGGMMLSPALFSMAGLKPITDVPEEIEATRSKIADVTFDDSFEPAMAMDVWAMRLVMYNRPEDGGFIYMVDLIRDENTSIDEFAVQMRNGMENQMSKSDEGIERLDMVKTETQEYTIRGEPADFEFMEGTSPDGATYYDVSGAFENGDRNVFLFIRVPASEYDEPRIRSIIESIK